MLHDPLDASFTEALHAFGIQLDAGVSLRKALTVSARSCRSRAGRQAFESASGDVDEREDFPKILDRFQKVLTFPERTILAAGWTSGNPTWAIEALVERRRLLNQVRREVRGAMLKPVFVLLVAGLVIPFPRFFLGHLTMVQYVLEAITPLGIGLGIWSFFSGLSWFRQRAWSNRGVETVQPPTIADRLLNALPLFAMLQRHRNLSEFALLMANLLQAGIMTVDALRVSARSLPNGVYRKKVSHLGDRVQEGVPLKEAMDPRDWPPDWVAMLDVADKTGEPDKVFHRLGQYSSERYVEAVRVAGKVLPRLAYVGVAIFVIFQIIKMWSSMAAEIQNVTG